MCKILILKNFRVIDERTDMMGSVVVEGGIIREVIPQGKTPRLPNADAVFDGRGLCLMPAFVDLHAHFRDPGFPEKETLESASLAAASGGYATVVCMANTNPPLDTLSAVRSLKARSDALGLIDLYPALSLTRGMAGRELSEITRLPSAASDTAAAPECLTPRLLSEDGKDVYDDALFRAAFKEAARAGLPVSCHCDAGGPQAEAAKAAGEPRSVWSRLEENAATARALKLGSESQAHTHIAHVSTKEAAEMLRTAKEKTRDAQAISAGQESKQQTPAAPSSPYFLTAEAAPHHIALTEETAVRLGAESFGRVNPPLRGEDDRQAVIAAIAGGVIDAIATDHAPHTQADKRGGAPGFTGLETSFAVCHTFLVKEGHIGLQRLSALMSANPGRILALNDRGRICEGLRADLVIVDAEARRRVEPQYFKSRGKNSPYAGMVLTGKVLHTMCKGKITGSNC